MPPPPATSPATSVFLPQLGAAVATVVRTLVAALQTQPPTNAGIPVNGQLPQAGAGPTAASPPAAAAGAVTPSAVPGQTAPTGAAVVQQGVPVPPSGASTAPVATPAGVSAAAATSVALPAPAAPQGAPLRADAQVPVPQRAEVPLAPARDPTMLDRLAALLRPGMAGATGAATTAAPAGTTAPQVTVAALPLLAVPASQAPLDARGVTLLAINDRAGVQRPDVMLAGVYTADGPGRRRLRRGSNVLGGRLSDLLNGLAAGAAGRGGEGESAAEVERIIANTMQWLFWVLAVVAYACLGLAIVALLPVGSEVVGSSGRQWTGGFAIGGLVAAAVAWLVARHIGARR